MKTSLNVSMEDLFSLIEDEIESGKKAIITVTGNSMKPFLKHERDQVILEKADPENLKKGDVVLYVRKDGQFVLHRICKKEQNKFTFLGDAQIIKEYNIEEKQIKAKAVGFIRKGKKQDCNSFKYNVYKSFWTMTFPFRWFTIKAIGKVKRTIMKIFKKKA